MVSIQAPCQTDAIISVLQMRKPRLRKVKRLLQVIELVTGGAVI